MEVIDQLYPQVYARGNLLLAWRKARKGKRGRPPAATFEWNLAENLLTLQAELAAQSYTCTRQATGSPRRWLKPPADRQSCAEAHC